MCEHVLNITIKRRVYIWFILCFHDLLIFGWSEYSNVCCTLLIKTLKRKGGRFGVKAPAGPGPAVFDCTVLKPTTCASVWVDKCMLNFTMAHGSK
jgi:hypothetical protein